MKAALLAQTIAYQVIKGSTTTAGGATADAQGFDGLQVRYGGGFGSTAVVDGGENAGRACWALVGTLCAGPPQGGFAAKLDTCRECAFYGISLSEGMRTVLKTKRRTTHASITVRG